MRIRRGVVVLSTAVLIAALAAPTMVATAASKKASGNALGVLVVRFEKGTTRQHMYDAVAAAGGEVVTDLSKLGRVAVSPTVSDFSSRIKVDTTVKAVWADKVVSHGVVDAGASAGSNGAPQFGSPGTDPLPDPWHDATSFWGETNPRGILQWDDIANGTYTPGGDTAWDTTTGDSSVRVAVIDSGVSPSHKELKENLISVDNTIPCNLLVRQFGPLGQMDCGTEDSDGHGTWVASRIAGAVNGFASNGIAPHVKILGYRALSTTLGGGLTTWIADAMVRACSNGADLINMSLGGYDVPGVDDEDYLVWVDATNYCRDHGTAIIASAGNEHVRINTVTMTIGGRTLSGVGQVANTDEGIMQILPGGTVSNNDLRNLLETPAGVPGVIMVSATNNANGAVPSGFHTAAGVPLPPTGALDQLTYYSSYGSRIDITAPGGARRFNIPRSAGGPGDILYGGWGELGALTASGEICSDPALASPLTFSCFKVNGAAFGWLQGTSMSAPNATGVAALALSAHHGLQGDPDGLLARLQSTARTDMTNHTGPNDPNNHANSYAGVPCTSGYCYIDYANPISFSDAYGAGMVNAGAAVAP